MAMRSETDPAQPLSLEDFKRGIDTKWDPSFETISPEYRRLAYDVIRAAVANPLGLRREMDYFSLTSHLAEKIHELEHAHKDRIPTVLKTLAPLAERSPATAYQFLEKTEKLLDIVDEQTYFRLGHLLRTLEDQPLGESHSIAMSLYSIVSSITESAPQYLGLALDQTQALAEKDAMTARTLLWSTAALLPALGPDRYLRLCDFAKKYDAYSSWLGATIIRGLPAIIKAASTMQLDENTPNPDVGPYVDVVLSATDSFGQKNIRHAHLFSQQMPNLIKRISGKPLTKDLLLLEYIHDPLSARVVGQVIDREKYRKEYAEKCQTFYKGFA